MFQKSMIFRSAMISLVVCLLISCSFGVVAFAADYSKIDISDYVSGREFVGTDVIVSYDLPLRSWTEMYGFATGSNTPLLIDSYHGALFFSQGSIDGIFDDFDMYYFYDLDGRFGSDSYDTQLQDSFDADELFNNCDWLYVSYLDDNGGRVFEYALIEWRQYASGDDYLEGYAVTPLGHQIDFWFEIGVSSIAFEWDLYFGQSISLGFCHKYVYEDHAEYQRINGNMFPLGKTNGVTNMIDVRDIRSGYGFTLSFDLSFTTFNDSETALDGNAGTFDAVWLDRNYGEVDRSQYSIDLTPYEDYQVWRFDIDFTVPNGAAYFYLRLNTGYFDVNTAYEFIWEFENISMITTLSSIEENSQTMGKVVYKLDQLDGKLDGVIDGLGDVKDVLQDTNDKLDDMQGTLEDLPGNIGDELENVIDRENDKHQSAGQQFVDQILDILPDSSTEIMAALRSLPDAMSYTGTEAVLQIPGIVMPAVGDLIPRTEIWPGAELDFSDYVELLPSTLLNLVRALFTIAIVLFCAFELKGIVSYCLTLKDYGRGA